MTRVARFIRGDAPITAMLRGFINGVRSRAPSSLMALPIGVALYAFPEVAGTSLEHFRPIYKGGRNGHGESDLRTGCRRRRSRPCLRMVGAADDHRLCHV